MPAHPALPGFLFLDRIDALPEALERRGYRCLAAQDDRGALALRDLAPGTPLPRGLLNEQAAGQVRPGRDPQNRYFAWAGIVQAIKPLVFAPHESLWRVQRDAGGALRFEAMPTDPPKLAVIGVRACDLAALALQDAHFLRAERADPHYAARRANLFLVAVQCALPAATCFCASTGDGPTPTTGFDIALSELAEGFVASAGSEAGHAVLASLNLAPATPWQIDAARAQGAAAAAAQTRRLPDGALHDVLRARLEHPHWSEVATRCLACGNCTAVCPTCFCHEELDTSAADGASCVHARQWDSCFGESHGHLHGFNVRPDIRSRYRQWLTHKLAGWHEQFGRSGCTGCGRCIAWCPVGIDLTEEVAALAGTRA